MGIREIALAAMACACACACSHVDALPPVRDPFAFRAVAVDSSLPDVDAIGYDIALTVTGPPGREEFGADVKGDYVATRELAELSLDFEGNEIESVSIDDAPARYRRDGARLLITLPHPAANGVSLSSRVRYRGRVGQADGANQNDLATFGGLYVREQNAEKRRIFSSLGWPSKTRRWLPVRDHPRDGAMVVWTITFPSSFTVLANGTNEAYQRNDDGTSTWRYEALTPMPPYDFHVAAYENWQLARSQSSSGVPISTYLYANAKGTRAQRYDDVPAAFDFYEKTFGKFRWNTVSYLEEPIFGGGMENATVISMDETLTPDDAHNIAVHELAHHWSGNLVRIRTWNDFWLSEGFSEYLSARFRIANGEPGVWHDYLEELLRKEGAKTTHPIRPPGDDVDVLTIFDPISYQKGALFLHLLERIVGQQALTEMLAQWFDRHAFTAVTTADFERELEAATGHDLSREFATFVYGSDHPEVRVSFTTLPGGDVEVKGEQTQTKGPPGGFVFPLDVDLVDAAGHAERVALEFDGKIASKHVHLTTRITSLKVDPDGYLLGTGSAQ